MSMGFSELRPVTNKLGHRQKGAIFGGGGREELIFASDGDVIGARIAAAKPKQWANSAAGLKCASRPPLV